MRDSSAITSSWRQKLSAHLALARISNSPTVITNTLAGAALAGSNGQNFRTALVAVAMVMFYTAGMYLNDLLDYALDCDERPERPLPSGKVSRRTAIVVVLVLFIIGSLLLLSVGWLPWMSGLVLIFLIICYDARHKSNAWSPLLMALCRAEVYVIAFQAFSPQFSLILLLAGSLLILYIVGLTFIAKTEKRPMTMRIGVLASLFLPACYLFVHISPLTLALTLIFLLWVVYSLAFVFLPAKRQVGRAVGQFIAGVALFDALVLAVAGNLASIGLALLAFALTLFLQRYIKGT
jgi:4-hydroxybenzoate polyprenyltransferase